MNRTPSELPAGASAMPARSAAPRVSVIVPNYNHERFLRQRLDSVWAQTFRDFEVIILDDASTDRSRDVIAGYLNRPGVRFVANERNSGTPFAQWNRGVALAQGDLVWIAESDDYAEPTLLATLVGLLDAHPNAGLAYCQSLQVDAAGVVMGSLEEHTSDLKEPARWQQRFVNAGRDECGRFLLWKNTVPNASAVVFRRAVFQHAGGAPTDMRLAGDWLVWARILLRSDVAYTPEALNYFRYHASTARARTSWQLFFDERWRVQRELVRAGVVSADDRRTLATAMTHEFLSRARLASGTQACRAAVHGLAELWPLFVRAPFATAKVVLERARQKAGRMAGTMRSGDADVPR